jgi:hypothetical protein
MGPIRASLIQGAGALTALALFSGCFLVVDLDRFHGPRDAGASGSLTPKSATDASDLVVTLDERRETGVAFDIVDARNVVVSRVIVADESAFELVVPDVLPNEGSLPYTVELFDFGGRTFTGRVDLGPDARDGDLWRADLRDVRAEVGELPRGRDAGANATIKVTGLAAYPAATVFEARVVERSRVVGVYRSRSHDDFVEVSVPGCIDVDATHEVVLLVDADGDGVVDDAGLVATPIRSASGIEATFRLSAD